MHHLAPTTRFYKLAYITRNGSLTLIRGVPATLCPSSLDNMIALDDLEPQDIFLICLQTLQLFGQKDNVLFELYMIYIFISHNLYLCTQNGFNNKKNEGNLKKIIVLLSFSVR